MARDRRDRVYLRSDDGKPTVVSSRRGNAAARLCRRHRVRTLEEARGVGMLPGFVNLEALEKEATRVLGTERFDREAEQLVGPARTVRTADGERVRRARIANEAVRLRATELTAVIEPAVDPRARYQIAGHTLQVLTRAPFDVTRFELDADLDLHTDLVFARDVSLARFGEVRIYRGAQMKGSAPDFFLHTASIHANLMPPPTQSVLVGRSFDDLVRSLS